MVLDERKGRLGTFDDILLHVPSRGDLGFRVDTEFAVFSDDLDGGIGHFFADDDVRTHPYGEAHDEAEDDLGDEFPFLGHAFLVVAEYLDIVIRKAEGSAPQGADQQEDDINVGQVAEQEGSREDGQDDDHPAHCRSPFLLNLSLKA